MLRRLILWANGNVMAFDETGEQIPKLQRPGVAMADLQAAVGPQTDFALGVSWMRRERISLSAEDFWPWLELAESKRGML